METVVDAVAVVVVATAFVVVDVVDVVARAFLPVRRCMIFIGPVLGPFVVGFACAYIAHNSIRFIEPFLRVTIDAAHAQGFEPYRRNALPFGRLRHACVVVFHSTALPRRLSFDEVLTVIFDRFGSPFPVPYRMRYRAHDLVQTVA